MALVLVVILLSGLASAATWGVVVWLGYKAAQAATQRGGLAPVFQELQALIAEAQRHQGARGAHAGLPTHIQRQFAAKLKRAQVDLNQLDRLARDRSELRMASMISDAGALGIDVSGWNR